MKFVAFFALLPVFIGLCAGFGGCTLKTPDFENAMTENIGDLEKLSGMKFPASAKILSAVKESGRDKTIYQRWIIKKSEPVELKGAAIEGDDNEIFIQSLKEALPQTNFGQPKNDKYEFSDWQNEKGKWQAAAVETDAGFFVKLEIIKLN